MLLQYRNKTTANAAAAAAAATDAIDVRQMRNAGAVMMTVAQMLHMHPGQLHADHYAGMGAGLGRNLNKSHHDTPRKTDITDIKRESTSNKKKKNQVVNIIKGQT